MKKTIVLFMIWAYCTLPVLAQVSQKVFCNQAGYNLNEAKFFTCPNCTDGKYFNILDNKGKIVFKGKIENQQGNFTAFNPTASQVEYVIEVKGFGRSVPFWIADHLMEKVSSKLAYEFFIDVRGGNNPYVLPSNITGGGPSRDGGGETLEPLFEGLLYASNPALFNRWTKGLRYYGDIMYPVYFPDEDAPDTDLKEYSERNFAKKRAMPDLVKLLLWHTQFAYNNYKWKGKAGGAYESWPDYKIIRMFGYEGQELQEFDYQNMLDYLAATCGFYHYFLQDYLTPSEYQKYRKVCLDNWETYDRHKEVRYWVKSLKWIDVGYREFNEQGSAFGQGLIRNLMMYLCELNEADGQSAKFLKYAQNCAEDIIKNWDFNNSWHTYNMRNAEHITPQALSLFYLIAPEKCPVGTKEKLEAYSTYLKKQTDNLWNYRKHNEIEWAHTKSKEIGTVAGMGGNAFATAAAIKDTKLRELGWGQVNYVFGLNPSGYHLGNKSAERVALGGYWDGVENGWPHWYKWGTGELGLCRGTLDGSPTNHAFPFVPDSAALGDSPGIYGTEGWGISNRAWMSTVTFSTLGSHSVRIYDLKNKPITEVKVGATVTIELKAALNQNWKKAEKGWVLVSEGDNPTKRIEVTETGPNTGIFRTKYTLKTNSKGKINASYGYMFFKKSCSLPII
jgi:hypothetical protein